MSDNNNSDLIVQLVRDLSNQVSNLPSRHEFDGLNSRLDSIENKIDKYVLQSEFNTYKQYADQRISGIVQLVDDRISAIVPRTEHETRWKSEDERMTTAEQRIDTLLKNKLPDWAIPAVVSAVSIIVNVGVAFYSHMAPNPSGPMINYSTPAPVVQPYIRQK